MMVLVARFKPVAHPWFSNDVACGAIFRFQLLSEVIYENPQVVCLCGRGVRPNGSQQGPVGDDFVGMLRSVNHQVEFFWTEVDLAPADSDAARFEINNEIADLNPGCLS